MKLFIAVPAFGGMTYARFTQSIFSLGMELNQKGHSCSLGILTGQSEIAVARNVLVEQFLESDCDAILFIDADHAFNAGEVVQMIESGKDFIGAIYPKKVINWNAIKRAALAGKPANELSRFAGIFTGNFFPGKVTITNTCPVEVRSVATGLLLLHRKVFERLKGTCRSIKTMGSDGKWHESVEYFSNIVTERSERLSEDYSFCHKWQSIGGKIWAAPWVNVSHYGVFEFNGRLMESTQVNDL